MDQSGKDYVHGTVPPLGILVTNLGTPDAPTPAALRRSLLPPFVGNFYFSFRHPNHKLI